jgi:serine/threonine protein kinase/rhodanese-related sulfurtransferase
MEKSIFLEAVEKPSAVERNAFLDSACGENRQLREEIERLLQAHLRTGDILDVPDAVALTTDNLPVSEGPGETLGRYKLLQLIAEGGMGTVFMAEQLEPVRRKVALKVIKLGMDTKNVIARFEAERQALAIMEHPNIAKVLDAGATAAGRPYFVMELVKGVPIHEYCDKNHLTARERLELFLPVCQAIQHAHMKGVIHRDIKPSNVMVTLHDMKPVPKVIDFGIAKATNQRLTEKTLFTKYGQMIGTPAYMSPEQAELSGLDVDTRTDVYALGVLLYELLTGTTPFPEKRLLSVGYCEMQRIIQEEEPPIPSTRMSSMDAGELTVVAKNRNIEGAALGKLLSHDLDWIVMKALEKERTRRYESPSALAEDIIRYLNNEPVAAVAPSAIARLQKFTRRNKALVTGFAAVFVALLVGVIGMTAMYLRSEGLRAGATKAKEEAIEASRLASRRQQEAEAQREKAERTLALVADLSAASELVRDRLSPERQLAAERVRELLDGRDDYRYLDVRTVSEFRGGHIPEAINIPIAHIADPELANWNMNGQFLAVAQANLPLDSPLIVGCRSGRRSSVATQIMIEAGYSRVYNFAGDANDLGYPLEHGDGEPGSYKSLFRNVESFIPP